MRRILIVDDDPGAHELTSMAFERSAIGAHLQAALCVPDALRYLAESPDAWDLILLDLQMPTLSGFDFLEMCANASLTSVPIVVLTTDLCEASLLKVRTYRFVKEFMQKPLQIQDIYDLIDLVEQPV